MAHDLQALTERVIAALPQTQCTRCGYEDCAAYGRAVAAGEADINQCPPGGAEGIQRLAAITGRPVVPLNPEHGVEGPRRMAIIDEAWCIGCTLCIKACPTDAIIGSNKLMHTIVEDWCTGCELCIPVCPVDCIVLEDITPGRSGWSAWSPEQAGEAAQRYASRQQRLVKEQREHDDRLQAKARMKLADLAQHSLHTDPEVLDRKRAIIEAALERARLKREQAPQPNKGR